MAQSLLDDTHRFIRDLKASGFSDKQAEGLTKALQQSDFSHLTTKSDLKDLELRLVKWIVTMAGLSTAILALLIEF